MAFEYQEYGPEDRVTHFLIFIEIWASVGLERPLLELRKGLLADAHRAASHLHGVHIHPEAFEWLFVQYSWNHPAHCEAVRHSPSQVFPTWSTALFGI